MLCCLNTHFADPDVTICFLVQIGDTPDDIRAALAAGSVPVGVLTPEEEARSTLNGKMR